MRLSELLYLVVYVLVFNLLMYSLGLTTRVLVLVSLSLLYTLLLTVAVIYLRNDLRLATAVTYVFLSIAFIFAYSLAKVDFRSVLGPYMLSATALITLIPAFVVLRQPRESIYVHLLLVSSLPIALLDTTGYALLAASVPYMAFASGIKDLLMYTIPFLTIYLPYTLLPSIVGGLALAPYPRILTVAYDVPGGEWGPLTVLQIMALTYISVGYLQLSISKRFLPRVRDLKEVLIHSLTSYLFGVTAVTIIIVSTDTFIETLTTTPYIYLPVIPFTSLTLASATGISKMLKEVSDLRAKVLSLVDNLKNKLKDYDILLASLEDLGLTLERCRDEVMAYSKGVEEVSIKLSRAFMLTPKQLEGYMTELSRVYESLNNLENGVLARFSSMAENVKEMYARVSLITGMRYTHIEDAIVSLTKVKELKEVPEALTNLRKVLKSLCETYARIVETFVSSSYDILGLRSGSNVSLACAESLVMNEVLTIYYDLIENMSRDLGNDIMTTYAGVISLGRGLESLVNELRVLQDVDAVTKLEDVVRSLRSLPELEVTPYRALISLREACRYFRDLLDKLIESAINEISSKEAAVEDITARLGIKLEYLKPYRARLYRALKEYSKYSSRSCKELLTYLNSTDLTLVRDLSTYINLLNFTLKRIRVLPLLIKYLDDRLEVGTVVLDEVPLSKDMLAWLLSVYLSNRVGVGFNGRTLKRGSGGTS